MKPKGSTKLDAAVRKIADPDTPEGRRTLARYVQATCIVDGMSREREELAAYIACEHFDGVMNASGVYPDDATFARIEEAAR